MNAYVLNFFTIVRIFEKLSCHFILIELDENDNRLKYENVYLWSLNNYLLSDYWYVFVLIVVWLGEIFPVYPLIFISCYIHVIYLYQVWVYISVLFSVIIYWVKVDIYLFKFLSGYMNYLCSLITYLYLIFNIYYFPCS